MNTMFVIVGVVDTREMLLHAMMSFVFAQERHFAEAAALASSFSEDRRQSYALSLAAVDAEHNRLLQSLDAWVQSGAGGFERLQPFAGAWAAVAARLDVEVTMKALDEASEAFNALAREAVRMANEVAAVN